MNDTNTQTEVEVDEFTQWWESQTDELDALRERVREARATAQAEIEEAVDTARTREAEIHRDYRHTIEKAQRKLLNGTKLVQDNLAKEMRLYNRTVQQAQDALEAHQQALFAQAKERYGVDLEGMYQEIEQKNKGV